VQEFSVRLQHLGHREAFALGTNNATVAATKAKEIAVFLDANGWVETRNRYKPRPVAKTKVCTVGEFLADVATHTLIKPITLRRYAVKLRKIVSDVAGLEKGMKKKDRRMKFDYVNGGHTAWLEKIHSQPLDILTPETIAEWHNSYVAKAGSDPVSRKSAERSAASNLRCCKALFSENILKVLSVPLPSNPFAGLKIKDPGPRRYQSSINAEHLLACAERELKKTQPQAFLGLVLCLWGGLRRKEADTLLWKQVNLAEGQIRIQRTEFFEPKTEESQRLVDIPPAAVKILRSYVRNSGSPFVMDGAEANPAATYDYYRCDGTWHILIEWLKGKGVTDPKAVHSLRKESGSLIASAHGIEAARQHLGHNHINTTSSYYVDKRKRIEVNIGDG